MKVKIMTIQTYKFKHAEFPNRLTQLYDPPKSIHTIGAKLEVLLSNKTIGVVGSRKVSSYGRRITTDLTAAAAKAGITVISGLALGVDSIAHQAALEAHGKTIAVLPSGIEKIYPAGHRGLAMNILQKGGALISEYSGKELPMRHQFIERNRIIAALSDALLITEAAEKSGSLHTARFALEIGRPVLAVPGNITSPTSVGTNNLIKMGGTPITGPQDIFDALNVDVAEEAHQLEMYGDNEFETTLLTLIREGLISGHELLGRSKLEVEDFQRHLTMLEIKGRVKPMGNDTWGLA